MKKLAKAALASTFALSTFTATGITTSAEAAEVSQSDGEISNANYSYNGHTGFNDDGAFILDQKFVDGLANNSFVLNGYNVDADPEAYFDSASKDIKTVYDQSLMVNEDGVAVQAELPINDGVVSVKNIESVYGQPVDNSYLDEEKNGMYFYFINGNQISFSISDGYVTLAKIGAHDSGTGGGSQ